jgi:hypothetical protein
MSCHARILDVSQGTALREMNGWYVLYALTRTCYVQSLHLSPYLSYCILGILPCISEYCTTSAPSSDKYSASYGTLIDI